jgi:hypothetical protein
MHFILKDATLNKSVDKRVNYLPGAEQEPRASSFLRISLLFVTEEDIEIRAIRHLPALGRPGETEKGEAISLITAAVDDTGKDLLREPGAHINLGLHMRYLPHAQRPPCVPRSPLVDQERERYRHLGIEGEVAGEAHIQLPVPDPQATKLTKLEGYLTVTQMLERKTLEVKPLEDALGKALKFETGGREIEFIFTKCEADKVYYGIALADLIPKPEMVVRFFDGEGNEVTVKGERCSGHDTQCEGEYRISRPLGPGAYAVIDYPASQEDVRVPFAFADVPLPGCP